MLLTSPGARLVGAQEEPCNAPARDAIVHLDMPGSPFEPVVTPDGCWILVTLAAASRPDGGVAVIRRAAGKLSVARTISLKGNPTGAVLTHDGKLLIITAGGYLAFVDAARLISGDRDRSSAIWGRARPSDSSMSTSPPMIKSSCRRSLARLFGVTDEERRLRAPLLDAVPGRGVAAKG